MKPLLSLLALLPTLTLASRLLVLLPSSSPTYTTFTQDHSAFFSSLQRRGYELVFRSEKDGERLWDDGIADWKGVVVVGGPSKVYSPDISPQSLYKYLTSPSTPGNLLLLVPPSSSDFLRDFAREFSADFSFSSNYALSHYPPTSDPLTLQLGGDNIEQSFFTPTEGKSLLYKGAAHEIADIPLAKPLVWGPKEGYVWDPDTIGGVEEGEDVVTGTDAKLVTAFQTRGGGRVVLAGSTEMFSDKFWNEESCNEQFVEELTKWNFGEKGTLRVKDSWHFKKGAENELNPSIYRIKDTITYVLAVEELTPKGWVPFQPLDMQLEFRMLDPHLRIPLHPSSNGTLSATFAAPDRHGVFTFLVDYRRWGLSDVHDDKKVSVTPLRHNEYPRWIKGAFPWYVGAVSTMGAFLVFSFVWLTTEDAESQKKVD
ncbi:Dolichyl-diphosphooligosaccharide-protein glycosyltransferase 48kDa subunit [Atractiella rhizophila]|nr:Dolichyl-diphosphooligosaccharide-protein glycosyltransferase 48kDa subunit [Atractiella rhizophila]